MTIAEVSDRCGYSQLTNFTRAFTRYFGVNPSDVRTQKNSPSQSDAQNNKTQLPEKQHFTPPLCPKEWQHNPNRLTSNAAGGAH